MRQSSDTRSSVLDVPCAQAAEMGVAILATRFNEELVDRLVEDARGTLVELGVNPENIAEIRVPGSLELPVAAAWLSESGEYDGIIALGVVIRGETAHFEYVCQGALHGLVRVSIDSGVPVMFGVLTTDTVEQALVRIEGPVEHKGADVARGVVQMIALRGSIAG